MATSSKVSIQRDIAGFYHLGDVKEESAERVSNLLQENHDKYHVFRSGFGIHNHAVHYLLTLYALGSSAASIEEQYRRYEPGQRPKELPVPGSASAPSADFGDYGTYAETLSFFEREIEEMGTEAVVQEYMFKGNEAADALLKKMFAHPLIHLAFGIEFQQPAIVAEAFAMAACTPTLSKIDERYLEAEAKAAEGGKSDKTLVQLLEAVRTDPSVVAAKEYGRGEERNRLLDGPHQRSQEEIMHYMSEWRVGCDPGALERKLAELINCSALMAAGAVFHPGKPTKFDFLLIHALTSWYATYILIQQPWITTAQKVRLVEFCGRGIIVYYAICGAPEVKMHELRHELQDYQLRRGKEHSSQKAWEDVLRRSTLIEDDGHSSKLIRSLALGEKVSSAYEGKGNAGFEIEGSDWLNVAQMAVDSLQPPEIRWVRLGGYDDAWSAIRDKA